MSLITRWTEEELTKIGSAEELELKSLREDGMLRNSVTIWVVRVGNDLYVRAVNGTSGKWYRHAMEYQQGHILAGGISKVVDFVEADASILDAIDEAYSSKYKRYSSSIVSSMLTAAARTATIKLLPRKAP